MHPPFPLPILIPFAVLALGIAALGAWRGSAGISPGMRWRLLTLRLLALAAALTLLFNPGKWTYPTESHPSPWILLNDVSASMAQATADGSTRAAVDRRTSPPSHAPEKFRRKNRAVVAANEATTGASGTGPTFT